MQPFRDFITESPTHFSVSEFPTYVRYSGDVKRLERFLDALNPTLSQTEVPNALVVEILQALGRVINVACNIPPHVMEHVRGAGGTAEVTNYYYDLPPSQANHVAGKLKKARAAKPTTEAGKIFMGWMLPTLEELLPLAQAAEALKAKAVKRTAKPKEDVQAKYIAPMSARESGKYVLDVLTELTNKIKGDYAKGISNMLIQMAKDYAALDNKTQIQQRYRYGLVVQMHDLWVFDRMSSFNDRRVLKSGFEEHCKKAGDEAAEDMQQQFIFKNAAKLSSILERKGIELSHKPRIIRATAGRGVFEGDIRIDFQDGSGFDVRNKVVVKVNTKGTIFNQFPTTFHNVVLKDGKPMSQPSEERMNEVFPTA